MCGRYGLFTDPSALATALRARVPRGFRFEPHYNVAPQQDVLGVRNEAERVVETMRWGALGPDVPAGRPRLTTINARAEGLATSPLYGPLLPARRCVVFADGYYEWPPRADAAKPQPVWIARKDRATFAFAGLWDRAGDDAFGCTIVTQAANAKLRVLHERMPVVLSLEHARLWLSSEALTVEEALGLLVPADGAEWAFHPVSAAVGNVRNDSAALIEPVAAVSVQGSLFESL